MTIRDEIIKILEKNGRMSLKEIYAHLLAHPKPGVRGVLNKGVAAGIFVRAGKGIYSLPSDTGTKKEKNAKQTEETRESKRARAEVPRTSKNPGITGMAESPVKTERWKKENDYIRALIDSVDRFAMGEEEKEEKRSGKKQKELNFEEVGKRLLSKGYRRADIELKVKDILVNDGTTAGVGKLEEELRAEYALPDELVEKAPSPSKESLLKCPSNGKYWDLKLLRRTLNDAGISFNRKTRRNLRFEVDENLLYAFTEAWDFAVVLAEAVPDSLEGRIVYALRGR